MIFWVFWWLRNTFGVILFAYNTLLPFSRNKQKSIAKGYPKVMIFAPKTFLWRQKGRWFYHFVRFLGIRKICVFSMALWVIKKLIKFVPGQSRGCPTWVYTRRAGCQEGGGGEVNEVRKKEGTLEKRKEKRQKGSRFYTLDRRVGGLKSFIKLNSNYL